MYPITRSLMKALAATAALAAAAVLLLLGYRQYARAAYPVYFAPEVTQAAAETGLPQSLLYAVIRTESGFHPQAVSSVDARGLMQITPDTFSWVRYRLGESGGTQPDLLFDPQQNIYYGSHTLALLVQEFGTIETALAAYHAGWGNVTRWLQDERYSADGQTLDAIPFGDTNHYVNKVLQTAEQYQKIYKL